MLVSVVLPVFNGIPYLRQAIDSILAQDIDFELIVSDDASTDGTGAFLKSVSDRRVRTISNTANVGQFGNINLGLEATRGAFIQIFSHDDLMMPGFLASQVAALQRYPCAGMVYGRPDYIDAAGTSLPARDDDGTPELVDRAMYLWIASHFGALPSSISSIMLRRETIKTVGLFDPAFEIAGDLEFYNRVSERFAIVHNRDRRHSVRSHEQAVSQHARAGQRYLREEIAMEAWYRARWNPDDYRHIRRFRSGLRGRYHLGWIRRLILNRQFGLAMRAVVQLNRIYPLHWVLEARILGMLRPSIRPRPRVPPPGGRP